MTAFRKVRLAHWIRPCINIRKFAISCYLHVKLEDKEIRDDLYMSIYSSNLEASDSSLYKLNNSVSIQGTPPPPRDVTEWMI